MIRILPLALAVAGLVIPLSAVANSLESGTQVEASVAPSNQVPMTAELVRRSDGSWVIAALRSNADLEVHDAPLADHPGLQSTFDRYRRAIARGDTIQLGRVWIMNPAERADMERLARQGKRVSISITRASLEVEGDRATVSFLQARNQTDEPLPRKRRLSRRGMAAFDDAGAWDLVTTR